VSAEMLERAATADGTPAPTAPEDGAPTRRRLAWLTAPVLVVLLIVVLPLGSVLVEAASGTGGSSPGAVLGSAEFLDALGTTAEIAVGTTVGALVLGAFLAVVLAFVPFPGATLVARLVDSVLALPSFLITLAFTFLYGRSGVAAAVFGGMPPILTTPLGVILAEITFFTPFVVRPLLAALEVLPRDQLEVASSLGAGPWRVLRSVVLPEAGPALVAGGGLVLLLSANEFGIVLFTGAKDVMTLPVLIYTRGVVALDLPAAAVVATAEVVLSLLLLGTYRLALRRLGAPKGDS
jgi:2-aminoethylphosphonate transport system permease protein